MKDIGLCCALREADISAGIESYITLDEDAVTCRQDTLDAIIEEMLQPSNQQPSSNEADDNQEDCDIGAAQVACAGADQALHVGLEFFQEHKVSEEYLRHIGHMLPFVTTEANKSQPVVGKARSVFFYVVPVK